jgi:hypothetical protein
VSLSTAFVVPRGYGPHLASLAVLRPRQDVTYDSAIREDVVVVVERLLEQQSAMASPCDGSEKAPVHHDQGALGTFADGSSKSLAENLPRSEQFREYRFSRSA